MQKRVNKSGISTKKVETQTLGKCDNMGQIIKDSSNKRKDDVVSCLRDNSTTQSTTFMGIKLGMSIPNEVYPYFLKRYEAVLPKMERSSYTEKYDAFVESSFGKPLLEFHDSNITMSSNASPRQFATDVILAGSKLLEFELNKRGIHSLHAAAIAYKGEGIIFLGPGGAGKTTTALSCCLMDKDATLISGSRLFVSDEGIVGGMPGIDLRSGSINAEFGEEFARVAQDANSIAWEERKLLTPRDAGIRMCEDQFPMPIKAFVLLKKLPKTLTVFHDGIDKEAFLLRLYDALYVFAELTPYLMLGNGLPYPDIYSYEMKKERAAFASRLLENPDRIYLEGDMKEMADFVLKNIARKHE